MRPLFLLFFLLALGNHLEALSPLDDDDYYDVDWETVIPESDTRPPPLYLSGHPKHKSSETGCIQIPSSLGFWGACSSQSQRKAGHLAVSIDGKLLAISEKDGSEVFVYETETLNLRHRLNSRYGMGRIVDMAFGARSRLVLSISDRGLADKGLIWVFDLESEAMTSHHLGLVEQKTAEVYGNILKEHMPGIQPSSPERLDDLVSTLVWETRLQQDIERGWAFQGSFRAFAPIDPPIGPDGKRLIVSQESKLAVFNIDTQDSTPPKLIFNLPMNAPDVGPPNITMAHFQNSSLPDQPLVVVLERDTKQFESQRIRIQNADTGATEHIPPTPGDINWSAYRPSQSMITFSPDGRLAAAQATTDRFLLWHAENGTLLRTIPLNSQIVWEASISFSHDGEFVFTKGGDLFSDGPIYVYNVSTGELVQKWVISDLYSRVEPENLSVDPRIIKTNAQVVKVQHAANGLLVCTLEDGSVALFDPKTNHEGWISPWAIGDLLGWSDSYLSRRVEVVVSPDGKAIYSSNVDGNVRVWPLE
ncbi:hypothetical protein VNI00_007648 [Paramarasmius palmivorus]|uniref:WD40 repeat domain-containing protein n=1 Tax=Paramarasmius palmivorus TaxID=297713 RepID=A0AAW0D3F0_9AGAR